MGQPIPFEYMGICVLSPAHECKVRGYLVLSADCQILIALFFVLFLIQPQYIRLNGLVVGFETFLEGSIDHIIYRDYTELIYLP